MGKISDFELKIYTSKADAEKAVNSLNGILLGIKLDEEINAKEIRELKGWITANNSLIDRNPFNEFMSGIENVISKEIPSKEGIENLIWACEQYSANKPYYKSITADLQILHGLCHGILSDGVVNEKEVFDLHTWLGENDHLNTYWPYDEIRSLVLSIVSDKKVDEDEKAILKAYFNQFVNLHTDEVRNSESSLKISALCTSDPNVVFLERKFCVTGVLKNKNRETLHEEIRQLGGIPMEDVSSNVHYLIVGDSGNPAWAFACYGRKVEKALNLRKKGHNIVLIHEFDFADIISES